MDADRPYSNPNGSVYIAPFDDEREEAAWCEYAETRGYAENDHETTLPKAA